MDEHTNLERKDARTNDTREKMYNFIVSFWLNNKYAPSTREIKSGLGLSSTSVVFYHLEKLAKEGKIVMAKDSRSRSVRPANMVIMMK